MGRDLLGKDVFNQHIQAVSEDKSIRKLVSHINYLLSFMDRLSFLIFGRDFIMTRTSTISLQGTLQSVLMTLNSIGLCVENGHFADANVLIRKYRDDLYFYLYVVLVGKTSDLLDNSELTRHEKNIQKWVSNELSDLYVWEVMEFIGGSPVVEPLVQKYNLKESFGQIGKRLNDYVHGNGISFYNKWHWRYKGDELKETVDELRHALDYITTTFLFLLVFIRPLSIMAEDYVDFMSVGMQPPEDSEYWVAPFVQKFFSENSKVLGDDCVAFLKEHTKMQIT